MRVCYETPFRNTTRDSEPTTLSVCEPCCASRGPVTDEERGNGEKGSNAMACTRGANHDDSWRLNWYSHAWLRLKRQQQMHPKTFTTGNSSPPPRSSSDIPASTHIYARRPSFHLTSGTLHVSSLFLPLSLSFSSSVRRIHRSNVGMHK